MIPYEFQLYDEASEQNLTLSLTLRSRVLLGITSSVEAVSCDEAFVFLKTSDPHAIIRRIRQEILQASGCVCSIGCSDAGKLLARIATRSAKPNGFCVVDSTVIPIQDFLDPLPVGDLPGVGSSAVQKLQRAGLPSLNVPSFYRCCVFMSQSRVNHLRPQIITPNPHDPLRNISVF